LTCYVPRSRQTWQAHKEDGKDYTFDVLCGLLINDQHRFLDEGKLGGKHQDHFLKRKGKMNYKERGHFEVPIHRQEYLNQKTKMQTDESTSTLKNRKKKTCLYCQNIGHVEKDCWKKDSDLKERVK
jgi:hypothetical protein